jgi:hypothetical protein
MSFELVSHPTNLCRTYSRQFWGKALELAQIYGWRPAGTCPPRHIDFYQLNAEWSGRYFTNDGQMVKAEDARALAAALERALDHISDATEKVDWNAEFLVEEDLPEWLSPEEKDLIEEELHDTLLDIVHIHPLDFFAGAEKQYLKSLIRFCRLGSFEIF